MNFLYLYACTFTIKVICVHYFCKKKYNKEQDDWVRISLYGTLGWMYLTILIVYLAQYNPMVTPELDEPKVKE